MSARLARVSYMDSISVLARETSSSVNPKRFIFSTSVRNARRPDRASPSLTATPPTTTSQVSQMLAMSSSASKKGAPGLETMSSKRSYMIRETTSEMRSTSIPWTVLFISSGRASLFQRSSREVLEASGSVMTPMIGSSLSGIMMTSFGLGFSGAGMSAKMALSFCSTLSTSISPTTMTA